MNIIGPSLRPVIKRLTLDDVEIIKANLKVYHEIPEIKFSPSSTIPKLNEVPQEIKFSPSSTIPKLNEVPQLRRGRSRAVENIERWRSHSEDSTTKCADDCLKWEHQLQVQEVSSLFPDSQTTQKSQSCTSPSTPSMVLDSDISVKEEMDIEDHMIHVDDCISLKEFSEEPSEKTECFVQSEYPCYKCDMVFPKSDLLLHHLKTHRTNQSACNVFSQKRSSLFSQSTPLRRSASNCIDLLLSKNLKYRCEYCGRGFSRSNYLELHLRAFFRNRTCDKIIFPRKKSKTPSQVQKEQKIDSGLNSNLLVSDHTKHNPVEDQNFVRAMMMHVAATAEDCFNKSKSELHEDKDMNSEQTGKETTINENMAPSERSGSTIDNAQNMNMVTGRNEGVCEAQNLNVLNVSGIPVNLGSQSRRIGKGVICTICKRRFKMVKYFKLHWRIHNKIRDTTEKGDLMATNSTNEVTLLESVNDESVFSSACQICKKRYKDIYQLKEHEMTHRLEASGLSNCSNISSKDPMCNFAFIAKNLSTNLENLTDCCEGGSNISGNSTIPKEQTLQSQKNEKENCSEVRVESTRPPSNSGQNVPIGDVPSNAKKLDVSQNLASGSSNAKEFSCYVCLEKLELETKTVLDLKNVVKSKYGKDSRVKKSTESVNSMRKTRMSCTVSNNNEGSSDSCLMYGKSRQTSRNICYRETRNYSRKAKEECSSSFESSIVSSASQYKKRYRCRHCKKKVFTQRKDYERHRMLECNAAGISCPLCGAKFYKKFLLIVHISRHFKSWKGVCTFILNRAVSGAFSKNKKRKKRSNVKKSSILIKSETNSVLQHVVSSKKNSGKVLPHLNKKQKKPFCISSQKLNQGISKYSSKVVHIKHEHRTNSLVRKLEKLQIHKCKSVTPAEKIVKCGICDKAFGSLKALKLHKRVHIRNAKHQCFLCEKEFGSVLELRMHVRTHYKKIKACSLCGEEFPNISSLLSHCSVHKKA